MIQVGIIEEDPGKRQELKNFINSQRELVCTLAATSVKEFFTLLTSCQLLLVVLVSITENVKEKSGATQIKIIKQRLPESDIIVLSDLDDTNTVLNALRAGALGYLQQNTSLPQIKEVIMSVASGGAFMSPAIARKITDYFRTEKEETYHLTIREQEIVDCLTEGLSYKMIASKLVLSLDTVRFHLRNIYKKLEVNSKAEVIAKVLKKDILFHL